MNEPRVWTGDIRREYNLKRLDRTELNSDPILQFKGWFEEAAPTVLEPNAMALATADRQGRPSMRMVLLKAFDDQGFTFGTSYLSRKSEEIASNPFAALLFYWPALERQVRISGSIGRTTPSESDEIFMGRSRASRLAARAVSQSTSIESREEIEKLFAKEKELLEGQEVNRPEFWGGYRVAPQEFEFWQGGRDRLHDRFLYTLADGNWKIERLQP